MHPAVPSNTLLTLHNLCERRNSCHDTPRQYMHPCIAARVAAAAAAAAEGRWTHLQQCLQGSACWHAWPADSDRSVV